MGLFDKDFADLFEAAYADIRKGRVDDTYVYESMDAEDVEYYGQIINQAKKDKASVSEIKKALKSAGASKADISDLSGMFESTLKYDEKENGREY